ncbi:MAG: hypothetical protein LUC33_02315 [Prevotellaceae bacterium]|nr:hypothetical protein [Prevotellaceae bacterium]
MKAFNFDTVKEIIVLQAEEQRDIRPFVYRGKAYHRMESGTYAMTQDTYKPESHSDGSAVWVTFALPKRAIKQATDQAIDQATDQVVKLMAIVREQACTVTEAMELLGLKHKYYFRVNFLHPAIELGFVELLYSDKPKHPRQKYRLTAKGKEYLRKL